MTWITGGYRLKTISNLPFLYLLLITKLEKSSKSETVETIFIETAFDYIWIASPRSAGERNILALTLVLMGSFLLLFGAFAYTSFLKWTSPSNYIVSGPFLLPFLVMSVITYWGGALVWLVVAAIYITKIKK